MTTLIVINAQHDDDEQPVIALPGGSLALGEAAGLNWYRIPKGEAAPEGSRAPTEAEINRAKLELPAIRALKANARRRIEGEIGDLHEIVADQARQIEALTALVCRVSADYLGGAEMPAEVREAYRERAVAVVSALDSGALTLRGSLEDPVDMIMRLLARSNRINEIVAEEYLPRRDGVLS